MTLGEFKEITKDESDDRELKVLDLDGLGECININEVDCRFTNTTSIIIVPIRD